MFLIRFWSFNILVFLTFFSILMQKYLRSYSPRSPYIHHKKRYFCFVPTVTTENKHKCKQYLFAKAATNCAYIKTKQVTYITEYTKVQMMAGSLILWVQIPLVANICENVCKQIKFAHKMPSKLSCKHVCTV